jgi:hypothetical protein
MSNSSKITLEVKNIPTEAQAKIMEVYKEMQTKWEDFQAIQNHFYDLITITRRGLGIPDNQLWDLADDASRFVHIPDDTQIQLDPEEEIVLTPEPINQTGECSDPGDVTGK